MALPETNTPTPVKAVLFKNRRRSVKYDMFNTPEAGMDA
jgi:hypothetical protein